jgi:hypothetical protein
MLSWWIRKSPSLVEYKLQYCTRKSPAYPELDESNRYSHTPGAIDQFWWCLPMLGRAVIIARGYEMEDKGLTSGRDRNSLRHSGWRKRRPEIDTIIKSLRHVIKILRKCGYRVCHLIWQFVHTVHLSFCMILTSIDYLPEDHQPGSLSNRKQCVIYKMELNFGVLFSKSSRFKGSSKLQICPCSSLSTIHKRAEGSGGISPCILNFCPNGRE